MRFRLPYDATTLENLLLKLDPGRSRVRGPGLAVRSRQRGTSVDPCTKHFRL